MVRAPNGEMIRRGSVYVLQNASLGDDLFKIGKTTGDPKRRAQQVAKHFGVGGGFRVLFAQPTRDADQLESRVHRELGRFHLTQNHPTIRDKGLETGTEFFAGLTLARIRRVIAKQVKGLELEDDWCRRLLENQTLIKDIEGVGHILGPDDPDVHYWLNALASNGSQPVTEFTLKQIASGVKHNAGKTSYLTWTFQGKARAWLDPTYPRAACTFIHRRFDGDRNLWETELGDGAIFYEYRQGTEIRLTLWTADQLKTLDTVTREVMPNARFRA